MNKITTWCGILIDNWQNATMMDYSKMALAVVLLGWFIARYTQR